MTGTTDPIVHDCERCPALVESRSQIVNGRGPLDAELLLLGEAPGRYEDEIGRPFVGRSGELLDESLTSLGVDLEHVRITNCVRCRPPDNRDPHVNELGNCRSYLDDEIAAVDPEVLLALGRVPARELCAQPISVTERVGETLTRDLGGSDRTVVIGLHPAATLYDRTKRPAFERALSRAIALSGLD